MMSFPPLDHVSSQAVALGHLSVTHTRMCTRKDTNTRTICRTVSDGADSPRVLS